MAHGCCFWIVWHVMSLNLNMGSNVKHATLNTALTIESMTKRQAQLKKLLPNIKQCEDQQNEIAPHVISNATTVFICKQL